MIIVSVRKVVIGSLLVLVCLLGAQATLAQEAAKRDLSRYEQGGEFTLRYWYGQEPQDEAQVMARARKLLWTLWRKKRLAHFAIVKIYTHGDSTEINYYVEPDEEGRWRVAVEPVSNCCALEALQGTRKIERKSLGMKSYYILSRRDAASGRAVPERETRRPETYTLLLYDGKSTAQAEVGVSHSEVL